MTNTNAENSIHPLKTPTQTGKYLLFQTTILFLLHEQGTLGFRRLFVLRPTLDDKKRTFQFLCFRQHYFSSEKNHTFSPSISKILYSAYTSSFADEKEIRPPAYPNFHVSSPFCCRSYFNFIITQYALIHALFIAPKAFRIRIFHKTISRRR